MSTSDQDAADPIDLAELRLVTALEDEITGATPPDLSHLAERADSRTPKWHERSSKAWLSAAIVLAVIAIVVAIYSLDSSGLRDSDDNSGDSANPPPDNTQDKETAPPPAIPIGNAETLARLAPEIRKTRIQVYRERGSMILLSVAGDRSEWLPAKLDRDALISALRATAKMPASPGHKEAWKHTISFELDDERSIAVAIRDLGDGKTHHLLMNGMAPLVASPKLIEILEPIILAAEQKTQRTLGVFDAPRLEAWLASTPAELQDQPYLPNRLRLVDCGVAELRALSEHAACREVRRLDLRWSPRALPSLDSTRRFPRLRSLSLPGKDTDRAVLSRIADLQDLEELVCLEPYESTGKTELYQGKATRIDDECLPLLGRLTNLRRLDLVGAAFTDTGLIESKIGEKLPHLEALNLSRCRELDGRGLRTFAGHQHLQRLWLRDLPGFSDAGARALIALPNLRFLDVTGSRPIGPAAKGTDEGTAPLITANALSLLARIPRLEELLLESWLSASQPNDRKKLLQWVDAASIGFDQGVTPMKRPADGIGKAWRESLRHIMSTPQLRTLSLRQSSDLLPSDLDMPRAARGLRTLDLHSCRWIQAKDVKALRATASCEILGPEPSGN